MAGNRSVVFRGVKNMQVEDLDFPGSSQMTV